MVVQAQAAQMVYRFSEGDASMADLLGGKGSNLCEMTRLGLPVPPGFVITTQVCRDYLSGDYTLPKGLAADRAYLFLGSSSKRRGMAGKGFPPDCGWGLRRTRAFYRAPGRWSHRDLSVMPAAPPLRPVRRCGPSNPPRSAGGACCP